MRSLLQQLLALSSPRARAVYKIIPRSCLHPSKEMSFSLSSPYPRHPLPDLKKKSGCSCTRRMRSRGDAYTYIYIYMRVVSPLAKKPFRAGPGDKEPEKKRKRASVSLALSVYTYIYIFARKRRMCACICAYKRNNNPRVLLPLFVPISQLLNPSFFRAQASERVVYTAAHISIGIRPPRAPCALHPLGVSISVRGSGARPLNSECLRDNATRHEPSLRVEATCPVGEHYSGYIHIYIDRVRPKLLSTASSSFRLC